MSVGEDWGSMAQVQEPEKTPGRWTSKLVTSHLANERTFLASLRTGLATIAIGFVVARFGLFLRALDIKSVLITALPLHYSAAFGVALTMMGLVIVVWSLFHFIQVRRQIDSKTFHPVIALPIALTVMASIIGLLLAIYLFLTP